MIKAFLSSTSKDLEPYRQRATKAINGIDGYHCIAMENFGARDSSAEVFCPDKVEECDLFVLLLGPTYGSCPPGSDKSYTHLEYEAAVALDKPRLIFASSKQFQVAQELISSVNPDQFQKQKNFRDSINADRIWGQFATPDELDALISRAIQNWRNENGRDTLTLRDMFDDPLNQVRDPIIAGGWYYKTPVDAIWEALWLMCRRMDEQRG